MNREPVKRGDVKIGPWPEKTRSADDTLVALDNVACCRF